MATSKPKKGESYGVYEVKNGEATLLRTFAPGWNKGHEENPDMSAKDGADASVAHLEAKNTRSDTTYEVRKIESSDAE